MCSLGWVWAVGNMATLFFAIWRFVYGELANLLNNFIALAPFDRMVIPVTGPHIPINLGETKKFVGNNLKLDFPQNRCTMLVIGNNCSLNISENFGAVKVIGNNCVVHIDECVGSVHYIGNNGSVALEGNTSRADCVTYTGTNGSITAKKSSAKSEESTSASSTGNEAHLFQTADSAIVIRNNVRIKNPCVTLDVADINQFFQVTVASV